MGVANVPVGAPFRIQAQTSIPSVSDDTLVDDPVALVDDVTALVGGLATTHSVMRSKAKIIVPSAKIRIRR